MWIYMTLCVYLLCLLSIFIWRHPLTVGVYQINALAIFIEYHPQLTRKLFYLKFLALLLNIKKLQVLHPVAFISAILYLYQKQLLLKFIFYLFKKAFAFYIILFACSLFKVLQNFLLFFCQIFRNFNGYFDKLIPFTPATKMINTFTF